MMKVLREPLVHFVLIGAGLFLVFGVTRERDGGAPKRIVVTTCQAEELAAKFSATWMRAPTKEELDNLIREHVRDEVYFREALDLGLDQNDPLIRRRLRQKLEFILEDLTAEAPPDDDRLATFLAENLKRFERETQVSFQQIYLNPDKRRDVAADAERILQELRDGADPESVGDVTLIPSDCELATRTEIARQFGDTFAADVAALEPGDWTGPLRSGFGGHLVKVTDRVEARVPGLDEVRERVERDWLAQRRQELKDAAYAELLESYEIVVEAKPDATRTEP